MSYPHMGFLTLRKLNHAPFVMLTMRFNHLNTKRSANETECYTRNNKFIHHLLHKYEQSITTAKITNAIIRSLPYGHHLVDFLQQRETNS
jgi:hypothetical protein